MGTFALWLLKSAAWLTAFAVVYFLLLRNERFFILKRIYLVTGILFSLIVPAFTFRYKVDIPASSNMIRDLTEPVITLTATAVKSTAHFDFRMIFLLIYVSGIIFLLGRTFGNFRELFMTIRRQGISKRGSVKLVRSPKYRSSFSFFNYVFISPSISEEEATEIMNHEFVHVRQRHWFDLLLVEILRMVQWVNPFAWIYTGFIRLNHEYLADQAALQRSASPANYRAALMNQLFDSPVISLSNSFNYSLNKKRFDMMKQKFISPWRRLKVLCILPVLAVILYAFAKPEYHYAGTKQSQPVLSGIPGGIQQQVKGIVVDENGNPVKGAQLLSTGRLGHSSMIFSGNDGRFVMVNVEKDATVMVNCQGYKPLSIKADFKNEMKFVLVKDPDYKGPEISSKNLSKDENSKQVVIALEQPAAGKKDTTGDKVPHKPEIVIQPPQMAVFIDGVYTDKSPAEVLGALGHDLGVINPLPPEQAIKKYGEKGSRGALDIMTRKKALEMGIKVPYNRTGPDDFPTFHGAVSNVFSDWLISQLKYPQGAIARNASGIVVASFNVNIDGSVSDIRPMLSPDNSLEEAVVQAIASSPRWDPPKNKEITDPFNTSVTIKFEMPDKIFIPEEPFVVVEEMPMFEGGDIALLKYIRENTKYPENEKANKISGRVIVRFVVEADGKADQATVLRGVSPALNDEAVRVVNSLPPFNPGKQGGKPVPVYYMVPINFTLTPSDSVKTVQ